MIGNTWYSQISLENVFIQWVAIFLCMCEGFYS